MDALALRLGRLQGNILRLYPGKLRSKGQSITAVAGRAVVHFKDQKERPRPPRERPRERRFLSFKAFVVKMMGRRSIPGYSALGQLAPPIFPAREKGRANSKKDTQTPRGAKLGAISRSIFKGGRAFSPASILVLPFRDPCCVVQFLGARARGRFFCAYLKRPQFLVLLCIRVLRKVLSVTGGPCMCQSGGWAVSGFFFAGSSPTIWGCSIGLANLDGYRGDSRQGIGSLLRA